MIPVHNIMTALSAPAPSPAARAERPHQASFSLGTSLSDRLRVWSRRRGFQLLPAGAPRLLRLRRLAHPGHRRLPTPPPGPPRPPAHGPRATASFPRHRRVPSPPPPHPRASRALGVALLTVSLSPTARLLTSTRGRCWSAQASWCSWRRTCSARRRASTASDFEPNLRCMVHAHG